MLHRQYAVLEAGRRDLRQLSDQEAELLQVSNERLSWLLDRSEDGYPVSEKLSTERTCLSFSNERSGPVARTRRLYGCHRCIMIWCRNPWPNYRCHLGYILWLMFVTLRGMSSPIRFVPYTEEDVIHGKRTLSDRMGRHHRTGKLLSHETEYWSSQLICVTSTVFQ